MQKKLEKELKSLAVEILQTEDFSEVGELKEKAFKLSENLSLLSFLNTHFEQNENTPVSKPEVIEKIKEVFSEENAKVLEQEDVKKEFSIEPAEHHEDPLEKETEEVKTNERVEETEEIESIFVPKFESVKEDFSQKEEFKDTISLDETEKLFRTKKTESKQLSLHDKLLSNRIEVGLNDRIAFVNNLFNFNQLEFNNVLDFLNGCENRLDALSYIESEIKPKYNWKGKEDLEERFIIIIERKFI